MANYISSNANRFYCGIEESYAQAAPITAASRFPAVKLHAHQSRVEVKRQDKTGSRTFLGGTAYGRRATAFDVRTYLTSWTGSGEPSYGPLFRAGLGGQPQFSAGLRIAASTSPMTLQTQTAHGLSVGGAVAYSGEIRFVTGVPDSLTIAINAPFTTALIAGAPLAPTVSYSVATALPSLTLYDFWDPIGAASRIVTGAGVDSLAVSVNGDYHEFTFSGPAADLLDSTSFTPGTAGLSSFAVEPGLNSFDYSIVPGHLGQVWLGNTPSQFFTLTAASIEVRNNIEMRNQEFGSVYPTALVPGPRQVATQFTMLVQDDAETSSLYAAAKLRTQVPAMLQLGQRQGQIMGLYLPRITPEIPVYNDSEYRLQWQFNNNAAQGVSNDELYIAFA